MSDEGSFDRTVFSGLRLGRSQTLGEPLVAVRETGSTNDDAFAAARAGALPGTTFVADIQTRGRGRRGHAWTSPPGENLMFSILLHSDLPAERVSALSLVVGLAVRSVAARRVDARVVVKWPNDVLVGRRKLAGILVETRVGGSVVDAIVVGVGINVRMRELPDDIANVATSLALLGDPAPVREAVLAEFLDDFAARLDVFVATGLSPLVGELRAHDALFGERLIVGDQAGTGAGIDDDGALLLRDDTGAVKRVTSGTVARAT